MLQLMPGASSAGASSSVSGCVFCQGNMSTAVLQHLAAAGAPGLKPCLSCLAQAQQELSRLSGGSPSNPPPLLSSPSSGGIGGSDTPALEARLAAMANQNWESPALGGGENLPGFVDSTSHAAQSGDILAAALSSNPALARQLLDLLSKQPDITLATLDNSRNSFGKALSGGGGLAQILSSTSFQDGKSASVSVTPFNPAALQKDSSISQDLLRMSGGKTPGVEPLHSGFQRAGSGTRAAFNAMAHGTMGDSSSFPAWLDVMDQSQQQEETGESRGEKGGAYGSSGKQLATSPSDFTSAGALEKQLLQDAYAQEQRNPLLLDSERDASYDDGREDGAGSDGGRNNNQAHSDSDQWPSDVTPRPSRSKSARGSQSTRPRSVAERKRRGKISIRLDQLKATLPIWNPRMDTASMLDEAIAYIGTLKKEVRRLESESRGLMDQLPVGSRQMVARQLQQHQQQQQQKQQQQQVEGLFPELHQQQQGGNSLLAQRQKQQQPQQQGF